MNQDFSELIKYLDEKFADVEGEISELKSDFRGLHDAVDEYAKKADGYF